MEEMLRIMLTVFVGSTFMIMILKSMYEDAVNK